MKVTVTTYLNVRVGKPSVNAPCYQYLAPGSEIEVDGNLYRGDPYEHNDLWLKDEASNYYWSGGVESKNNDLFYKPTPSIPRTILSEMIILKQPLSGTGKGITIGILDTGIDLRHPSLKAACISDENFLTRHQDESIKNDHGTRVAGILVGNNNVIQGLAPESKIISYRTNDNNGNTDDDAVIDTLNHIIDNNVSIDILNLSLDITYPYYDDFQTCIDKLAKKGIIVVMAGFTKEDKPRIIRGIFPVGIFHRGNLSEVNTAINPANKIAFLDEKIMTMGLYNAIPLPVPISSLSAYTAVTSGLVAKFLSSNTISAANRIAEVEKFLQEYSFGIQSENSIIPLKPYKNENG